jgi:hypothetical protein
MKLTLSLILLILYLQLSAQSAAPVTFKDGTVKTIGEAKKGCIGRIKEDGNDYLLNEDKYCDCTVRAMAKLMTYQEVVDLKNKPNVAKHMLEIPGMQKAVEKCLMESIDTKVAWTTELKTKAKTSCVDEIKADDTGAYETVNPISFCDCMIDKIALKMSYGMYKKKSMNEEGDDEIIGIAVKCLVTD